MVYYLLGEFNVYMFGEFVLWCFEDDVSTKVYIIFGEFDVSNLLESISIPRFKLW